MDINRSDSFSGCGPAVTLNITPLIDQREISRAATPVISTSPIDGEDVEWSTPKLIHRLRHTNSILCVEASVEKQLLFAGTQDSKIIVFDLFTGERKATLSTSSGAVLCLKLIANDTVLFASGSDSLVRMYKVDDLSLFTTIYSLLDIGDIFSLAWSPQQNAVYFGSQNASISWVDLKNVDLISSDDPSHLPLHRFDPFFDSRGPGGKINPLQAKKVMEHVGSNLVEVPFKNIQSYAHFGYVYSMIISPNRDNEDILISGGGDGTVKLWSLKNKQSLTLLHTLQNESPVLSLSISQSFLYCGLIGGDLKLWDLGTFQQIRCSHSNDGDIMSLAVYNNFVFKGTQKGISKVCFPHEERCEWIAHNGHVLSVKVVKTDESVYLISGSNDNSIAIWDISSLQYDNSINSHGHGRRSSTISSLSNKDMIKTLTKFISYKSISSVPTLYIDDSRRCATFLSSLFTSFGAKSRLLPVENGNPVVYACFNGKQTVSNKKRTRVLFYGHYDVIVVKDTDKWNTDPFHLTALDNYLYGRGVTDNKGPILAALFAVAELLQEGNLDLDIIFLIEGEEESGSCGFQRTTLKYKHLIGNIDWVLFSNSYWLNDTIPCLNYGLRGVVSAKVEVSSDRPDRHSGVDGGVSREPTIDLINLLSKLTDDNGNVIIPGFLEPVMPVTDSELKYYENILIANNLDANGGCSIDKDSLMAKWRFPSLTIHNVSVSGPGNSTIIPQTASASLSIRLVPNQTVQYVKDLLFSHLRSSFATLHSDNHLSLKLVHCAEPWLGNPSNAAFQILRDAIKLEWGLDPLFIREGGSIPSIRFLEKEFDAPVAHFPCGQSSDNAHLDNERIRIVNFFKGRSIFKSFFKELGLQHKKE